MWMDTCRGRFLHCSSSCQPLSVTQGLNEPENKTLCVVREVCVLVCAHVCMNPDGNCTVAYLRAGFGVVTKNTVNLWWGIGTLLWWWSQLCVCLFTISWSMLAVMVKWASAQFTFCKKCKNPSQTALGTQKLPNITCDMYVLPDRGFDW